MHEMLQNFIVEMGREIVRRVNARESLELIEQDVVRKLASFESVKVVISGYNRRNTNNKNLIQNANALGKYVATLNLLDGLVNYSRTSRIYGMSISFTNIEVFEHFSFMFDNFELMATTIEDGKTSGFSLSAEKAQKRSVVGLGRMFPLSARSSEELENVSLRCLGSTTVSLAELLRNRMDIFVTKTKMWTIWWALGLSNRRCLFIEDLASNEFVGDNYREYLYAPDRSIYIACYRNQEVRREFTDLIKDVEALATERRR